MSNWGQNFHTSPHNPAPSRPSPRPSRPFPRAAGRCRHITAAHPDNLNALLDVGALLSSFGFLTTAREYLAQASAIAPNDLRPLVNIANLARDAGDHAQSRALYASLLARLPNQPVVRRNAVVSLEYDPDVSDPDRLAATRAWGDWAMAQAGGVQPRPRFTPHQLAPCALAM